MSIFAASCLQRNRSGKVSGRRLLDEPLPSGSIASGYIGVPKNDAAILSYPEASGAVLPLRMDNAAS
jgi:hypothetical protein